MNIKTTIISKCIKFSAQNQLYFDFTEIMNNYEWSSKIANFIHSVMLKHNADCIIGHGYGGAQLCGMVSSKFPRTKSILIRSEPHKTQQRQIEGLQNSFNRAIIIDDAIFSGKTVDKIYEILPNNLTQKIVASAFIYDDDRQGSKRILHQRRITVESMCNRIEIGLTRDSEYELQEFEIENIQIHKPSFGPETLEFMDLTRKNYPRYEMKSRPVWFGDIVINASDDYKLTAYKNNEILWSYDFESVFSAPDKSSCQDLLIDENGFLYIGFYDGSVKKINVSTGDIVWNSKIADYVHSTPVLSSRRKDSQLFVNTETYDTVTKTKGGSCVCLDASTGQIIWEYPFYEQSPITPLVDNGICYSLVNDASFNCIKDGVLQWRLVLACIAKSLPVIHNGFIYVIDIDGFINKISLDGVLTARKRATTNGWNVKLLKYLDMIVVYSKKFNTIFGVSFETLDRVWLSKQRENVAEVTLISENEMLVCSRRGYISYYSGVSKIWDTQSQLSFDIVSAPAINKNKIAFNSYSSGFFVYKL